MSEHYVVYYSQNALDDLREIYVYIAHELLVPEIAAAQVKRIQNEIRSLNFMPARHAFVRREPWHSMGVHQLPVDHFIVYYLVDNEKAMVTIVRILYGGRDIEEIMNE